MKKRLTETLRYTLFTTVIMGMILITHEILLHKYSDRPFEVTMYSILWVFVTFGLFWYLATGTPGSESIIRTISRSLPKNYPYVRIDKNLDVWAFSEVPELNFDEDKWVCGKIDSAVLLLPNEIRWWKRLCAKEKIDFKTFKLDL